MTTNRLGSLSVVLNRYQEVRERLSLLGADSVQVIPVTKYYEPDVLALLPYLDLSDFAENYYQGLMAKCAYMRSAGLSHCRPHFMGRLTTRTCADIANTVSRIDSVSSLKALRLIHQKRSVDLCPLEICLQVNIGEEKQKQGFYAEALAEAFALAVDCPRVRVVGLMALVRLGSEQEEKQQFGRMRRLFDDWSSYCPSLTVLSMGTSQDFCWAAACGATEVRIGRYLFEGERDE